MKETKRSVCIGTIKYEALQNAIENLKAVIQLGTDTINDLKLKEVINTLEDKCNYLKALGVAPAES